MNIFDFIDAPEPPRVVCKLADECDAYPIGCGGTIWPCRFGGAFKWRDNNDNRV